jgi:hypothetical protein
MKRALIAAATLLALAGCGSKSPGRTATESSSCRADQIPITTTLPAERDITIKIYNGTTKPGLAEQVAAQFQYRGFRVQPVDRLDVERPPTDEVAIISFGPKTVAAAQLVRAYLLMTEPSSNSDMKFDLKNTSAVVSITIGSSFRQVGAPTEVHNAIAALGGPEAPPGTCATAAR